MFLDTDDPEQNCLKPPREEAALDLVQSAAQGLGQDASGVSRSVTGTTVQLGVMLQGDGAGQGNPMRTCSVLGN